MQVPEMQSTARGSRASSAMQRPIHCSRDPFTAASCSHRTLTSKRCGKCPRATSNLGLSCPFAIPSFAFLNFICSTGLIVSHTQSGLREDSMEKITDLEGPEVWTTKFPLSFPQLPRRKACIPRQQKRSSSLKFGCWICRHPTRRREASDQRQSSIGLRPNENESNGQVCLFLHDGGGFNSSFSPSPLPCQSEQDKLPAANTNSLPAALHHLATNRPTLPPRRTWIASAFLIHTGPQVSTAAPWLPLASLSRGLSSDLSLRCRAAPAAGAYEVGMSNNPASVLFPGPLVVRKCVLGVQTDTELSRGTEKSPSSQPLSFCLHLDTPAFRGLSSFESSLLPTNSARNIKPRWTCRLQAALPAV